MGRRPNPRSHRPRSRVLTREVQRSHRIMLAAAASSIRKAGDRRFRQATIPTNVPSCIRSVGDEGLPQPFRKITNWKGCRAIRPGIPRASVRSTTIDSAGSYRGMPKPQGARPGMQTAQLNYSQRSYGVAGSIRGRAIRAIRPCAAFSRINLPPCSVAIAETIERPRPFPGRLRLRSSR